MCFKRVIPCDIDQYGVLTPSTSGIIDVIIITNVEDTDGSVSGSLMWGGKAQAFLTFDQTGSVVIGFTSTDLSNTSTLTESSIRNILLEI